jgi:hypothetical protein
MSTLSAIGRFSIAAGDLCIVANVFELAGSFEGPGIGGLTKTLNKGEKTLFICLKEMIEVLQWRPDFERSRVFFSKWQVGSGQGFFLVEGAFTKSGESSVSRESRVELSRITKLHKSTSTILFSNHQPL